MDRGFRADLYTFYHLASGVRSKSTTIGTNPITLRVKKPLWFTKTITIPSQKLTLPDYLIDFPADIFPLFVGSFVY